MSRPKIALIGGGQVGGNIALLSAQKELGDIIILDIPEAENFMKGKALDISQLLPHDGYDSKLSGTSNFEDIKDSDVVVITAGFPRQPGMNREDLLQKNLDIMTNVANQVKKYAPKAFVIVVSNPLDAMVYAFHKISGFPKNKVVGMAGILDSSRFIYFLSQELKVSVGKIKSFVLGGHGDSMVAMLGSTEVEGKKINELVKEGKISQKKIEEIVERTKKGGAEIVKYLEKGSAFYAPAASGVEMAESYLKDLKKQLPCAVHLNGEYGAKDIYAGVPVIIGSNGVEKVIQLNLSAQEKENFDNSIKAVKELFDAAQKIDSDLK